MIAITYRRNGITYDFLRFRNVRFMRRWLRWAIPDAVIISVRGEQ